MTWVICTFNIDESLSFLYKLYELVEDLFSKNDNYNFHNYFYEQFYIYGFMWFFNFKHKYYLHNLYEILKKTKVVVLYKDLNVETFIYIYICNLYIYIII